MSSSTQTAPSFTRLTNVLKSIQAEIASGQCIQEAKPTEFAEWCNSVQALFARSLRETMTDVMDDSGRSVQPFSVEADAFLLQLITQPQTDIIYSGQILYFIYRLERELLRLTERHREVHFVFFSNNEAVWENAPYIKFLRALMRAYLDHVLHIRVVTFKAVDTDFISYLYEASPLFIALGDAVLTPEEYSRLQTFASFGTAEPNATLVDVEQLQVRLKAICLSLVRRGVRCVRLPELISQDGMLSGLMISPRGDAIFSLAEEVCFPANAWATSKKSPVTGTEAAAQAKAIVTVLTEMRAKVSGSKPDLGLQIATSGRIPLALAVASSLRQTDPALAALLLIQTVLLEDLPLADRAQPPAVIEDVESQVSTVSRELRSKMLKIYGALEQVVNSTGEEDLAFVAAALRDAIDGRILHRLLILHLQGKLTGFIASSKVIEKLWSFVGASQTIAEALASLKGPAVTGVPESLNPRAYQKQLVKQLSGNPESKDGKLAVATSINGSTLQEAWAALPSADPVVTGLLLELAGAANTATASLVEESKDDKGASKSKGEDSKKKQQEVQPAQPAKTEPEPEPEVADDWDAEPADDWDVDEPEPEPKKAEPADDWDVDEEEAPAASAQQVTESKPEESVEPEASEEDEKLDVPYLAEGESDHWSMKQHLDDGATMATRYLEQHVAVNPIKIPVHARDVLKKLLERCRDPKATEVRRSYVMPTDKEIQAVSRVWGYNMTVDKAKAWLKNAIEIKIKRAENRMAAKFGSTQERYVRSMKTPSKTILRDIIATEESAYDEAKREEGKTETKHKQPKKKQQTESVADKASREIAAKKAEAAMRDVQRFIAQLKQLRITQDQRIEKLDEHLHAHADMPSALYGYMELLQWRVNQWKDKVENRVRAQNASQSAAALEAHMEAAVRLHQLLSDLTRRFLAWMSPEQAEETARSYALLGFQDMAIETLKRYVAEIKRKTDSTEQQVAAAQEVCSRGEQLFSKPQTTAERRYNVGMSRGRFLMQYCGHTLLRNVRSAYDPRVQRFYPDYWQRQLLDIVDRGESALVVAPTSAGKTLVSFYTVDQIVKMNKELKSGSQKHVVVFIAPTYALARQMEADIMERTSASVYVHDTNLALTHSMAFDVLITVPSCMETLLFSPDRLNWVKRIKYVVFDEVHSIGSTLNGPIWERLFLLIHHCSFLALSATVGGADRFHQWLMEMRAQVDIKNAYAVPSPVVHKVCTTIRWSHLHHYFYIPPASFLKEAMEDAKHAVDITKVDTEAAAEALKSEELVDREVREAKDGTGMTLESLSPVTGMPGLEQKQEAGWFLALHPCSTVSVEGKERQTNIHLLSNVEFSTADTLQLYDTMVRIAEESPRMGPATAPQHHLLVYLREKLNPDTYFSFFVEKLHCLQFEEQLKEQLRQWHEAVLDTEILDVVASLSGELQQVLQPLTEATRARRKKWIQQFLPLMRQIRDRDWFPAIVFCLDRTLCVELAEHLVRELEAEEMATWIAEGDKRADKKALIKENERLLKIQQRNRDKKSKGSAEAAQEEEDAIRMGLEEGTVTLVKEYNPLEWGADRPDIRFSFVNEAEWMPSDELDYWQTRVTRKASAYNGQHPLIKALFRGFGVHSFGVEKSYRDLVEVMFRGRHLKFVISTETLGLGVNMPCRTTVFAFTTVELNPLNYRQMSGRAGRRGFDDKGQVVFFGIDPRAACRLMTSSLTDLTGHFHLSCVTVLRVLLKYYFIKDANGNNLGKPNVALQDQRNLLAKSFFAFSQMYPQATKVELLHHFRLCITYFQFLQLFPDGRPCSLAYLLATTATRAEGFFILTYLLRRGALEAITNNPSIPQDEAKSKVMTLLANLLFPIPIRKGAKVSDFPQCPGKIILPTVAEGVSPRIAEYIEEHDRFVVKLLTYYSAAVLATRKNYIDAEIDAKLCEDAVQLPLSACQVSNEVKQALDDAAEQEREAKLAAPELSAALRATAFPSKTRSPFYALAGKGDVYTSAAELLETVRGDLHVHPNQLPLSFSTRYPDSKFNAYALDFFENDDYYGDMIRYNGIDRSRAWESLERFNYFLRRLKSNMYKMTVFEDEESDESSGDDSDAEGFTSILASNNPQKKLNTSPYARQERATSKIFSAVYNQFHTKFAAISRQKE